VVSSDFISGLWLKSTGRADAVLCLASSVYRLRDGFESFVSLRRVTFHVSMWVITWLSVSQTLDAGRRTPDDAFPPLDNEVVNQIEGQEELECSVSQVHLKSTNDGTSFFKRGNFLCRLLTSPFDELRAGFWKKRGRGDFDVNYVADFCDRTLVWCIRNPSNNSGVIPGNLALASATRNPEK